VLDRDTVLPAFPKQHKLRRDCSDHWETAHAVYIAIQVLNGAKLTIFTHTYCHCSRFKRAKLRIEEVWLAE